MVSGREAVPAAGLRRLGQRDRAGGRRVAAACVKISLTTSIYCLVRIAGRQPPSEPWMTDRIHLVVATPCFGGQVSSIYASSIFQLQRAVQDKSNLKLKVLLRDGDAL